MFPAWSSTTAWFTSEFVYTSIPWIIGAWVVGWAFGRIFKLLREGIDAWRY